MRGFSSQLALWRLLARKGLWFYPRFPVTDQSVYKRLATEGPDALQRIFERTSLILRQRLAPYAQTRLAPFATGVYALDETTLDPVARRIPALRDVPRGDRRLLPGKLAGVYDVRTQQWTRVQYLPKASQNEKVAAREMLAGLPAGSLILADMGYFGFAWFDYLTDHGYSWISRLRAKTTYKVIHVYYRHGSTFDAVVWLGKYRADRAAHAVRLLQYRVGNTWHVYVTNLLDPAQLSMLECTRLYARRWDFELAVKLVKRHLKLHLFWSSKTNVILHQIWAVLTIAQILQALQLEIAARAGAEPEEVSLALMVEYMPDLARDGIDPVAFFVEQGRDAYFIRPTRRIQIRTPAVPLAEIRPLPEDLPLLRTPLYAGRRCQPVAN
jgi:hypothetical protein